MRILHAYNQHRGGGGADNAARATIEVTRRHGFQVEVFTRNSEALPKNLRGRLKAAAGAVYARKSVKAFERLLDSVKPDVVHVHEVFPLVSPWILPRCNRRGIPVVMACPDYRMTCPVVTHLRNGEICTRCTGGREHRAILFNCRGNLAESLTVAFYNAMVRKLRLFTDHVDRFIAPSEFTREWLIEHANIEPSRIVSIAPVVEIPENGTDPGSGGYVAYAGRFTPEKGIATLLEAARLCRAPFRLARNADSLIRTAVPSGIDVVTTDGREDLIAFYRGARMVVTPSVWFETFGLVAAEAMSYGIPVVASRIGALENLIEDGVDGLLCEPGNPQDLSEKIMRLWNDPDLCRRLGRAARAKAIRSWSPERHFELHRAVYESL